MKKLINIFLIILALSIILPCTLSVFATSETPVPENLFDKQGDYVRKNPFGSDEIYKSWHLNGKNVITNGDDKSYPISVSNKTGEDSFYYVAGSNSLSDLADDDTPIKFLENDFVFEYELTYDSESDGHISIVMAYNYAYYIDAYISSRGTGDITIVAKDSTESFMVADSILDTENPDELIRAIYGVGKSAVLRDKMIVSIRVTVGENNMPKKIYMYLNGCLVAESNDQFATRVKELTPEYTIEVGAEFPKDALGNIIAIKSSDGSVGKIGSVSVYPVDNDDYTPDGHTAKYYSQYYGNASFDESMYPEFEENSTEISTDTNTENTTESGTGEESTEELSTDISDTTDEIQSEDESIEEQTTKRNRHDDDEEEYLIDVISTLCLILGCASAAIIVAAVVILKLRTREK